jgi:GalNAc-alpha-(1->4)-GalNAc-alpha-(1->3)-diNAcBac-PP-undecaprenol alpha-1,4-N-acetyl-D-galactosaminyltransferase
MANHWIRRGNEVTMLTYGDEPDDPYPLVPDVRWLHIPIKASTRTGRVAAMPGRVRALHRALHDLRPDAVISRLPRCNLLTLLGAIGLDAPVITCEGIHFPGAPPPPHARYIRRLVYGRRLDAFVVQSEDTRRAAEKLVHGSRVYVVPNFLNTSVSLDGSVESSAWKTIENPPRYRLVSTGRLTYQKGIDVLLRAFAELTPAYPEWGLLVMGEGVQRVEYETMTRDLGLGGRVWFPGWIADPGPTLADSTVFALATRLEGFPSALLEAMAAGLPVVSTDAPTGPRDVITDGVDGLLVASEDVAAMAAALQRLMDDHELRARLGSAARAVRDRYSIERVMPMWDAVVDEVVSRRRHRVTTGQR